MSSGSLRFPRLAPRAALFAPSAVFFARCAALPIAACMLLATGFPTFAQPATDPETGLSVTPPPGYVAKPRAATGPNRAAFEVKLPSDTDTGCQVAFAFAPQNASLTQDQINDFTAKPEWIEQLRTTMTRLYDVLSVEKFEHAGVRGGAMVGDIKALPNLPARATEIRSLLIVLETPKGRTSAACVDEKASFDKRRPEFEAVVRGTTLPR